MIKIEGNNYIIAEINIREEDVNKKIRIINSFEEYKRNHSFYENEEEFENAKEIKDNCKIKINNNVIDFSYFYEFKEKGKYIIQYTFINIITKTDFLFFRCKLLSKIDLSNFNTQNVNNMRSMFDGCTSLTNINLSNFNT